MTRWISSLDELHSHYGAPGQPALRKQTARLTPAYRAFIQASREVLRRVFAHEGDPRIAITERELTLAQTVVSGLLSIHVYGASRPKECLSAMSFSFRSEEFTARFHVPSYEAWLFGEADLTPAYAMHRLVLQILQRRRIDLLRPCPVADQRPAPQQAATWRSAWRGSRRSA
ncbi:MAG: hypothetical protein HC933_22150 [Pleurocapsa sp. SU_196_0]|nr:hypothetical protein [Pleurocapsa sp. SU_196_0]